MFKPKAYNIDLQHIFETITSTNIGVSIHDLCLLSWYSLPPFIRPQLMMRSSTAGGIIGARPVPPPPRNLLCNGTLSPGEPVERWVTGMPPPAPRPRAPAAGHKHICRRPRPSASCPWRGSSGPFLTGAQDQTPTPQSDNTCGGTPHLMYVDDNIWFAPRSHRHSLIPATWFILWTEIETLVGKRMDIYHFIFKKR